MNIIDICADSTSIYIYMYKCFCISVHTTYYYYFSLAEDGNMKVKVKDLLIVQISITVFNGLYRSPWQGKRILLLAAVDPTLDLSQYGCMGGSRQCRIQSFLNTFMHDQHRELKL